MKTLAAALVVILAIGALSLFQGSATVQKPTNFEECVAAGNPVMESYPRQCRSAEGDLFVENIEAPMPPGGAGTGACVVAGCSSQLCVDASQGDLVSDCMFRPEYACYQGATCERQPDGECDWTETPALIACLAKAGMSGENLQVR